MKAQAEEDGHLTFTRKEVINFALANNPNLTAAYITIDAATARYSDTGTLNNPVLSFGAATDRGLSDEGQDTYVIGFQQQFPITNRLQLLKNIAEIEIQLAQAEIRNQERLLILNLDKLIIQLAALDEQIAIRRKMVTLNERLTGFLQEKAGTGEASLIDANHLKIALHAARQEIQKLTMSRDELLASIGMLMGLPLDADFAINVKLSLPKYAPRLHEIRLESLEMHPEYKLKRLLAQIAGKRTELAIAKRWADIALEVFFQYNRSVDEPVGVQNERFIGVGFSIPLPIHNQNRGRIEAGQAYQRQMECELDAIALEIHGRANIHAKQVFRFYQQALDYSQNVTQLVEQNIADIYAGYRAGHIDLTMLFRAQEQALNVQSSQLDSTRDYELALVELQAATAGNLSYFTSRKEATNENE